MPIDRYYVDSPLEPGAAASIKDAEFHHLAHVTRLKVGQEAELVNGRGALALATLQAVHKKEAMLHIYHVKIEPKPARTLILAQGLPRLNRLDIILEKVTELGATEIWLFPGDLSERKSLSLHQLERLKSIIIASLKQCGRLWLPELVIKEPLQNWNSLPYSCFYGDLSPEAAPLPNGKRDILILIGPESGLSEEEETILQQLNFQGVKLSENILRTDTAAIVAIGILASTYVF